VRRAGRELAAVTAYLVLFALAFLGWGLSALRAAFPAEPMQSVVLLAAKLVAMVLLPAALLAAMGQDWRGLLRFERPSPVERRALVFMGALLLLLQLVQTRASAWLRSEVAGLVAMAVLFGLAHAPGCVLRGAHAMEGFATAPDPLTAAAYSIVVVSPIGLAFGVPNLAEFVRAWSP
jgi:hypothetical protein